MIKRSFLLASLLAVSSVITLSAGPKKGNAEEVSSSSKASLHVKGKPKTTVLAALAKISYQDAMAAAVKAVPGKIVSGELTVDEGALQFDFEIVTPAKKVMDVSIDAGDGKVLDVSEGEDE